MKIKNLARNERHILYKLAYEIFKLNSDFGYEYICNCTYAAYVVLYELWNNDVLKDTVTDDKRTLVTELPELLACKPPDVEISNHWWRSCERQTRCNVFEKIIEQTKDYIYE